MKDIIHKVRREIIKKKKIVTKNLRKINTQTQKMRMKKLLVKKKNTWRKWKHLYE